MPELPEVETVKKYLESNIKNQVVTDVILNNKKSLRNESEKYLKSIIGEKIVSLDRKAKNLIINFETKYMILHLRMEGKFFIFDSIEEMNNQTNRFHDVMTIHTNKKIILFQDTRRFATIDIFDIKLKLEDNPILIKVANEPFTVDVNSLFEKIHRKRTPIKATLLDQSIISGLGNIYVDEVLYCSEISPTRISNEVTIEEVEKIKSCSIKILNKAIELGGTTIRSYTSSLGVEGGYQNHLKVHHRQNEKCKRDGGTIIKIVVGGRGTYYCPNCQK